MNLEMTWIWECDFDRQLRENEEMKIYFNERIKHYSQISKYGDINIRESFYGGRTNNLKFTYECKENESLKYYDFTSLYPYVLVNNKYPVGHPELITENFGLKEDYGEKIKEYFGFIKCKVLPPKDLYIPILPMRINSKLVFPLCMTCSTNKNQESCNHSDKERELCGTWTSCEIQKAVKLGYKIKSILQVLHYDEKRSDIFQEYIKTWLKIKTQASDWPKDCVTREQKDEFILQFNAKEGITLITCLYFIN